MDMGVSKGGKGRELKNLSCVRGTLEALNIWRLRSKVKPLVNIPKKSE